MSGRRLLVIGAGPVGLAAALAAVREKWDVTVLERDRIGGSLERWGATRFFTPLGMNLPPGAAEIPGLELPPAYTLQTGPEFVASVLMPLGERGPLAGRVLTGHRVISVGRNRLTRSDYAGHPIRAEREFRVLVESGGTERCFEAEAVIDASGTLGQPLALGSGGVPAPGERALAPRLLRTLGDLEASLARIAGRRLLLVGHGHSAANAILRLAATAGAAPGTRVTWAVRTMNRRPCVEASPDPLPERHRVSAGANALAAEPPPWLDVQRRAVVEAVMQREDGTIEVTLSGGRIVVADEIAAFTGYRPDLSIVSELALTIDAATEGSAQLARALRSVTDCLAAPQAGPGDLESGEAGFYLAGSKSYGRARTFLLQTGYAHAAAIVKSLGARRS